MNDKDILISKIQKEIEHLKTINLAVCIVTLALTLFVVLTRSFDYLQLKFMVIVSVGTLQFTWLFGDRRIENISKILKD